MPDVRDCRQPPRQIKFPSMAHYVKHVFEMLLEELKGEAAGELLAEGGAPPAFRLLLPRGEGKRRLTQADDGRRAEAMVEVVFEGVERVDGLWHAGMRGEGLGILEEGDLVLLEKDEREAGAAVPREVSGMHALGIVEWRARKPVLKISGAVRARAVRGREGATSKGGGGHCRRSPGWRTSGSGSRRPRVGGGHRS